MKLRIGVTSPLTGLEPPPYDIGAYQHCLSLERLGAEAILLRNDMPVQGLISDLKLTGVIFSGGGDVAPGSYGGDEALPQSDVDFRRDAFEFALMERALEARLPILATCRGMEVINVVLGGTLIGDLKHHFGEHYTVAHHQVEDSGQPFDAYAHDVTIVADSILHDLAQMSTLRVNSIHHQAIAELGQNLRAVGYASDGIIEAIEFEKPPCFFVGVQWHPEWLPHDLVSRRLYERLFAEASRSNK